MSVNLVEQLRNYGEDFTAAQDEIRIEDVADRSVPIHPIPQEGPRRGWVVAVAAAIVVLVIVGGALLVGGPLSGRETPVVNQPDSETSVATQPTPETTLPPPPTTLPSGTVPSPTAGRDPQVDFATGWRFVPEISRPVNHGATRVVAFDGVGIVVVTTQTRSPVPDETNGPVGDISSFLSFFSPDGSTWSGGDAAQEGFMGSIVAGGPGFMAAGTAEDTSVAALWSSPDGVHWERVPSAEMPQGIRPCDPEDPRLGCAISISTNSSSLVVTGFNPDPESAEGGDCAWWLSQDGINWQRITAPLGQEACVRPGSDGWLAIDSTGAVSGTTDGVVWDQRGSLPGSPSIWERDDDSLLASKGGQWLAVSVDNGQSWEVAELPVSAQSESAAIMDDGFVVTALTSDGTQYLFHRTLDDTLWSATELIDLPAPAELTSYESRLYATTISGVWEWTPAPTSE